MLKKILLILFAVIVVCYMMVVFVISPMLTDNNVCDSVRVVLSDDAGDLNVITTEEIDGFLKKRKLSIVGHRISDLNADSIEKIVEKHPMIRKAECYISPENEFIIEVLQRKPIFRVMDNHGNDYYVDSEGQKIEKANTFVCYLPVLTGNVDDKYVNSTMFDFISFIEQDDFWSAQIEQIHVKQNMDVILVPRVGDNTITLGLLEDYEAKLDKVKLFYKKGLSVVGWNKYKNINVEFDGQIIAEKR